MYKSISDTVLFLDTETGGVEDHYSLLSLGLIKVDENLEPIDEVEFIIKNDPYILSPEACKINGFDLLKHEDTSLLKDKQELVTLDAARIELSSFVNRNFAGIKPSIAAWNSPFDYRFIRNHIFESYDHKYAKVLGYRQHDLSSIMSAMCHAGVFPFQNKGMQFCLEQLGIDAGKAHTSLDDTRAMIKLYKAILNKLGELNGKN